ncbi:MAG: hypothetical protein IPP51_15435 [Bacteroidetes bacterium]|nr:hypothetical protein [Bacteroidota bacterium]
MKNIIFLIITTFLFGFHSENVQASHAAGAELRYECIGNDQYIITMIFYRDCFGIPPSNPMGIQVVSSCSNDTLIYLPQVSQKKKKK